MFIKSMLLGVYAIISDSLFWLFRGFKRFAEMRIPYSVKKHRSLVYTGYHREQCHREVITPHPALTCGQLISMLITGCGRVGLADDGVRRKR